MSRRFDCPVKAAAAARTEAKEPRSSSMMVMWGDGIVFLISATVDSAVERVRAARKMAAGLWRASCLTDSAPRPELP